ncbi:hypothetical protein ACFST9_05195 [Hymenobacter monticola]|uniref:Alpha/beta hydrolase n=1 Tax=Hymenobacter monticola TaxID=1705399 RepID=A0ABY4BE54_9BACT|nr:hypothetical protein [Hymenobacter monticola]UOE36016.1 hypothetical protein MTP16_10325 [Hymenobacter monticola]
MLPFKTTLRALCLFAVLGSSITLSHGQRAPAQTAPAQHAEKVGVDSTHYYLKLVPKAKPIGIIIILHGGAEDATGVMHQITLDEIALKNNFIVAFPTIEDDDFKMNVAQGVVDKIAKQLVDKYHVSKGNIFLGGLSGGGMQTLTYAERAIRDRNTYFTPKGIFALDPPLDYENMYYRYQREVERNFSAVGVSEAKWFLAEMEKNLGGTPETAKDEYIKNSMFSCHQKEGGNAKYLLTIPIRIYTEPGIEWQLKNRHRDLYDLNCTDISALINFLQLNGNNSADMVVTHDKGVRPNGMKHPHSWSIMDSSNCMAWILKQMK